MNNLDERQRRINSKITSATVTYMSNAKWRKLFNAFIDYPGNINGMRLKFVDDERLFSKFGTLGPYEDDEVRFRDEMPSPYAPFREIDFLLIPKTFKNPNADPHRVLPDLQNDLCSLKSYLDKIAKFPIQTCENGSIKILGYQWIN